MSPTAQNLLKRPALALCAVLIVLGAIAGLGVLLSTPSSSSSSSSKPVASVAVAPTAPPVEVCGNATYLSNPATSPPSGAVVVPAGLDSGSYNTPNTVYWFAAGTHTLPSGQYEQIIPGNGDTYEGATGAILSGQQDNDFAFTGQATGVTVEYLTITDFGVYTSDTSDAQGGVVNQGTATDWTITNDTITENGGAGVMVGTNGILTDSCLSDNGQYGFQSYQPAAADHVGSTNVSVTDDEFVDNDQGAYNDKTGCGCAATAGKFWDSAGVTFDDNYVHLTTPTSTTFQGDPCIWADTNNSGITMEGNYLEGCNAEGIDIEASYFNSLSANTIVNSGWGYGPVISGFPLTAIYISESGYDGRAPDESGGAADITGNNFDNDWGGVVLWENSNRFGESANGSNGDGSDGYPTLVEPTETCPTTSTKAANVTDYWDCRWRTQNVSVTDNTFSLTPSVIGSSCTQANYCGFNGIFSEYASYTPYTVAPSPDQCDNQGTLSACSTAIPNNPFAIMVSISTDQNNLFASNTYCGPWAFMPVNQGDVATFAQWQAGYTDGNGADATSTPQDAGSTLTSTCSTSPTTTTTSQPTTTTTTGPTTTTTTGPTTTTTAPTTTTTAPTTTTTEPPTTTTTTVPTEKITWTFVIGNRVYKCTGTAPQGSSSFTLSCTDTYV
jgi:hypothetical protein